MLYDLIAVNEVSRLIGNSSSASRCCCRCFVFRRTGSTTVRNVQITCSFYTLSLDVLFLGNDCVV